MGLQHCWIGVGQFHKIVRQCEGHTTMLDMCAILLYRCGIISYSCATV